MSELISVLSTPKEKQSFSFSKEFKGVDKTVRGELVENGWVITVSKEWYTSKGGTDAKDWHSETKKYISTKDPRESAQKEEENQDVSGIGDLINSIAGENGMLIV